LLRATLQPRQVRQAAEFLAAHLVAYCPVHEAFVTAGPGKGRGADDGAGHPGRVEPIAKFTSRHLQQFREQQPAAFPKQVYYRRELARVALEIAQWNTKRRA